MRYSPPLIFVVTILLLGSGATTSVFADEFTQRIQQDLAALGYEPGTVDGELSNETVVAIAKFQSAHDMPVTGEVSPLLAGTLSAEISEQGTGITEATSTQTAVAAPQPDPTQLRDAQQACLQEKIAAAQSAKKKKRGLGSLLRVVTRTASRAGNYDLAQTAGDIYSANASAADLASAAKDLGITEDEVAACQNP